jgi:hypothetical protein
MLFALITLCGSRLIVRPPDVKASFEDWNSVLDLCAHANNSMRELSSLVWTVPTFGFVGPTWPAFSFFSSARNGDRTQLFFETFEFFTRKAMPQKLGNVRIHTNVIKHKSRPWGLKGFAEAVAQLPKVVLDANLEFEDPSWIRFVVGE